MSVLSNEVKTLLGLDIGAVRTGVAIVRSVSMIPSSFAVINNQDTIHNEVAGMVRENNAIGVVIGLPRSMNGQETEQTAYVRVVAARIEQAIAIPVYFVDEAVTSIRAEDELRSRRKNYQKEDIDMLSAVYILEDFLQQNSQVFSDVS